MAKGPQLNVVYIYKLEFICSKSGVHGYKRYLVPCRPVREFANHRLPRGGLLVRVGTDLIAFNSSHADQELIVFGQEIFEMAQAKGPLSDEAFQKALATLKRCMDVDGLATLFAQQGVEVLLSPSNGPADLIDLVWGDRRGGGGSQIASAAAIAGYPSLTAPAGLIHGLPQGITLVAARNQDGLLLQVARAYERVANARVPPHLVLS